MKAPAGRCAAFVQARMSSSRFPGKVLAPYRGLPLIRQVVASVERALGPEIPVIVLTSCAASDEPLVAYLEAVKVKVFRGSLDNVALRFRQAIKAHQPDWVLRVTGDSPAVGAAVLRSVLERAAAQDADLVTTTFPRTFPHGNNAELLRVSTFLDIAQSELTDGDREHVTQFYYRNPDRFRIVNVASTNPTLADSSIAVDTVEDLKRLERLTEQELQALQGEPITERRVSA